MLPLCRLLPPPLSLLHTQKPGPTSAYVDGSVCQVYETLEQADQQAGGGPATSALQVVKAAQAQADPPLPYVQGIMAASLALINQTDTPPPPQQQQQQDEEETEQSESSASFAPGEPAPAADSSSSGGGGAQRGGRQLFIPGYR